MRERERNIYVCIMYIHECECDFDCQYEYENENEGILLIGTWKMETYKFVVKCLRLIFLIFFILHTHTLEAQNSEHTHMYNQMEK